MHDQQEQQGSDWRPTTKNGKRMHRGTSCGGTAVQEEDDNFEDLGARLFPPMPTVHQIEKATKEELLDPGRFDCDCDCTVLGHAIKNSITLEALELWLDRAPEVISIQNKHGNVALSQVGNRTAVDQAIIIANRTPPSDLLLLNKDGDTPLHCMLRNGASDQVLQTTIEKCPATAFSIENKIGRLPIHFLSFRSSKEPSKEVAALLIRLSPPGSLLRKDKGGMTPLVCALSARAQMEVITLLVNTSPSSLSVTNNKGQLPVHVALSLYTGTEEAAMALIRLFLGTSPPKRAIRLALAIAIRNHASAEVIELFLEYSPSNIVIANVRRGKNLLALAVESCSSTEVVETLLSQCPLDVVPFPDKRGKVPLHYIQQPAVAVELLVQRFPEMLLIPDLQGKLPIHYAMHRKVNHDVIKLLVEHCPASLSVADNQLQLPVHALGSVANETKLIAIQRTRADDLLRGDKNGRLPLHLLALKQSVSLEVIMLLVERCPGALLHYDNHGRLPLFYAIAEHTRPVTRPKRIRRRRKKKMNSASTGDLVKFLAEQCPEAIVLVDPYERVLFHDLFDQQTPVEIIELFVRLLPSAVRHADSKGRLPLHCALENKYSSEMVHLLLKGFPGAVACRDKQGRLPLYIACNAQASLDTVFRLAKWSPGILGELDIRNHRLNSTTHKDTISNPAT